LRSIALRRTSFPTSIGELCWVNDRGANYIKYEDTYFYN